MRKITGQGITVKISFERMLILLVICVFLATCAYSLPAIGSPITKEEAMEISKSADAFRDACLVGHYYAVDADYADPPLAPQYKGVVEGYGAWEIVWAFANDAFPATFVVLVAVDAGFGKIVYDTKGAIGW